MSQSVSSHCGGRQHAVPSALCRQLSYPYLLSGIFSKGWLRLARTRGLQEHSALSSVTLSGL